MGYPVGYGNMMNIPPVAYVAPQAVNMLQMVAGSGYLAMRPTGDNGALRDHTYWYVGGENSPFQFRLKNPFKWLQEKIFGKLSRDMMADGYSQAELAGMAANGGMKATSSMSLPGMGARMPYMQAGYPGMGMGMPIGGMGMPAMGGFGAGYGMPTTGGGMPYVPGAGGFPFTMGGPISMMGGDVDNMVGGYAANLESMTGQIEALMAKGDLSEKESRQLQWLMMKRSELSMLISQIMSAAHDTRKHIIQSGIRA